MSSIVDIFNFDLNTLKDFKFDIDTSRIDYENGIVGFENENDAIGYIRSITDNYSKLKDYQIVDKYLII